MCAPPIDSTRHGFSPWRFGGLLALLILATFPQVIFGLETFVARDYGCFAYPLAQFQRDCFWRGELPFWNPYNNCGVPFLAQWNTMPFYPPALLYLTLPLAWSLSFFCLLHLWFAGLGMFFLARRWTGNSFAAAFAGTAFAFNGFTLNLLIWPSHIATFSWLPWVVLAVESAWRRGGKGLPLAAFAGALQMLAGGPETILLTWLIVSALWLQQFIQTEAPRSAMLWRYPLVVGLVWALTAVQLLPFLDLVAHAQRESGYTDLRWSMPGSGLANFLVPMAFGSTVLEGIFFQDGQYWTSSYYLGLGTLWLAILAIAAVPTGWSSNRSRTRTRRLAEPWFKGFRRLCGEPTWLLLLLSAIALLCALGDHTPFYPWLRKLLPQLSFITYPVKFVLVVVFAAPLLAAFALTRLQRPPTRAAPKPSGEADTDPASAGGLVRAGSESGDPHAQSHPITRRRLLSLGVVLLLLVGGITAWTQLATGAGDDAPAALLNGISRAAFLLLTGAALWALTRASTAPLLRFAPLILVLIAWWDVITHEPRQNPSAPPGIYERNLARHRLAMQPQPELGRSRAMLSPEAALALTRFAARDAKANFLAKRIGYCANVNVLDGIPKVDGFFSLTPRWFDTLLSLRYSVTNGDWSGLEEFMGVSQYSATTNFLGWQPRANFRPLVTAGQTPVLLDDTHALWAMARTSFDPATRVFLPPEAQPFLTISNSAIARITAANDTPQAVDFTTEATAPALAVIAQSYYPDWRAEIDGQPARLLRANVAFQAVQVPAGTHHVHLFYRDRAWEIGAAISICLWVNCFVSYLALRRRELPASPAPPNGDYF